MAEDSRFATATSHGLGDFQIFETQNLGNPSVVYQLAIPCTKGQLHPCACDSYT